jgi:hypothetical protein
VQQRTGDAKVSAIADILSQPSLANNPVTGCSTSWSSAQV